MKKVLTFFLVLLLILAMAMPSFAAVCPVVDMAGLLTEEEQRQLIQMLAPYGNGAVQIVTLDSLEGENIEDYAEDLAAGGIGVVFVVAVQERKWCMTPSAEYEGAVDGDVIDQISAQCIPYLRVDDYYGAFSVFAEQCGYYLEGYEPSAPSDSNAPEYINYEDDEGMGIVGRLLICLAIGLTAGGIIAGILASKNKSVRPKNNAADYVRTDSLVVTVSKDTYLYHNIVRIPKPQNNGSSGGGSRSTRSGGF